MILRNGKIRAEVPDCVLDDIANVISLDCNEMEFEGDVWWSFYNEDPFWYYVIDDLERGCVPDTDNRKLSFRVVVHE